MYEIFFESNKQAYAVNSLKDPSGSLLYCNQNVACKVCLPIKFLSKNLAPAYVCMFMEKNIRGFMPFQRVLNQKNTNDWQL